MSICIALAFTILCGRIVPARYFEPYVLELDSVWQKQQGCQDYIVDIEEDGSPEFFRHHNINSSGNSLEFNGCGNLAVIYIFAPTEQFLSRSLCFADINYDGIKEILFVSGMDNKAYLNILEYNGKEKTYLLAEKVAVDSYEEFNNSPDIENYHIITDGVDIYLDLHAGYTIQPRNIYKYNSVDKTLLKGSPNSIVRFDYEKISYNNKDFLVVENTMATGNTDPLEDEEISKNDSLVLHGGNKRQKFKYGDFSSYVFMYDDSMDFAFEPIEFRGETNYTRSAVFFKNDTPYIVALTNTRRKENEHCKTVTVCNMQGEIEKQIPMPFNFTWVFTDNESIVFFEGYSSTLYLYSNNLELIREIHDVESPRGFFDLDNDNKKEFLAYEKNNLVVFTSGFVHKIKIRIAQEYAPYSQWNGIKNLKLKGKPYFSFNSKLFYYIFHYGYNPYAFLKYPFYVLLFAFWFGILLFVVRLNTKRLEKEKRLLEQIVADRTVELKAKNRELVSQKDEIKQQAKKLGIQNEYLKELGKLRKMLINTLVHDLKNPLGQIISISNNKTVNGLARRMLLLVTNMLDVEKYDRTEFVVCKEKISLKPIVDEVVKVHEISLREKNIGVIIKMHDVFVFADRDILMRVFDNLFSNSIRFSPQNRNIEVSAYNTRGKTVGVRVKNYGKRIPEEIIDKIFEKYTQAEKTSSSNYKSTGLGLAFCRMALQAHGYDIKAENCDDSVIFKFNLDGSIVSSPKINDVSKAGHTVLSLSEKETIKPWLDKLKAFEIYQVSDIAEVLEQIPDRSGNVTALKKQIADAVFACNEQLYFKLIQ